jgi:hypothetical protein
LVSTASIVLSLVSSRKRVKFVILYPAAAKRRTFIARRRPPARILRPANHGKIHKKCRAKSEFRPAFSVLKTHQSVDFLRVMALVALP